MVLEIIAFLFSEIGRGGNTAFGSSGSRGTRMGKWESNPLRSVAARSPLGAGRCRSTFELKSEGGIVYICQCSKTLCLEFVETPSFQTTVKQSKFESVRVSENQWIFTEVPLKKISGVTLTGIQWIFTEFQRISMIQIWSQYFETQMFQN